jgi:hypothetical protein
LGFRTADNLPTHRGFDTFLGLLGGGSDHYTKTEEACGGINSAGNCSCGNYSSNRLPFRVDYFDGEAPAHALWDQTTYDAYQFTARAVELVNAHDPTEPFFLYWAPHKVHSPLQAPDEFTALYPMDPGGSCLSSPETCEHRGCAPPAISAICRLLRDCLSIVGTLLVMGQPSWPPTRTQLLVGLCVCTTSQTRTQLVVGLCVCTTWPPNENTTGGWIVRVHHVASKREHNLWLDCACDHNVPGARGGFLITFASAWHFHCGVMPPLEPPLTPSFPQYLPTEVQIHHTLLSPTEVTN